MIYEVSIGKKYTHNSQNFVCDIIEEFDTLKEAQSFLDEHVSVDRKDEPLYNIGQIIEINGLKHKNISLKVVTGRNKQ